MKVAQATAMDTEIAVIAFTANGTGNPDAIIVININKKDQKISLSVSGTGATAFEAYRTTRHPDSGLDEIQEKFAYLGTHLTDKDASLMHLQAG